MSDAGFDRAVTESLSIHLEREGATVFARLWGELDIAAEMPLDEIFKDIFRDADDTPGLIVDMRGVSFLDTSGMRILLRQEIRSRRDGFEFALIPPRGEAMRELELAGISRLNELRTASGTEPGAGAKAAERASAGLGTSDDDPADWLVPNEHVPTGEEEDPI